MRSVAASTALVLVACTTLIAQAPSSSSLDTVLDRLDDYLLSYEMQLTSLVADERYDQRHIMPPRTQAYMETTVARRRLDSDVAFMRISRDGAWYGFRDTRQPGKDDKQDHSLQLRVIFIL